MKTILLLTFSTLALQACSVKEDLTVHCQYTGMVAESVQSVRELMARMMLLQGSPIDVNRNETLKAFNVETMLPTQKQFAYNVIDEVVKTSPFEPQIEVNKKIKELCLNNKELFPKYIGIEADYKKAGLGEES